MDEQPTPTREIESREFWLVIPEHKMLTYKPHAIVLRVSADHLGGGLYHVPSMLWHCFLGTDLHEIDRRHEAVAEARKRVAAIERMVAEWVPAARYYLGKLDG